MDARGARDLAARIKAGIRIGARVELVSEGSDPRLRPGDAGVVVGIEHDGRLRVGWDRGLTVEIEPTSLRLLAA